MLNYIIGGEKITLITKLAKRFTNVPFSKIFRPIYGKLLRTIRQNNLAKFGTKMLGEFDEIMIKNGIHYSVYAGTLLGAIREKGFIKHDFDIDTVMFSRDYDPRVRILLENAGFKLIRTFLADEGRLAREETYMKYGIGIDIFYVYSDKYYPTYLCEFQAIDGNNFQDTMNKYGYVNVRRFEYPISYNVKRAPFEDITINILENSESWLSARYGDDYMVPNPNFIDRKENPHIFIWEGVKGIMHCS